MNPINYLQGCDQMYCPWRTGPSNTDRQMGTKCEPGCPFWRLKFTDFLTFLIILVLLGLLP